MSDFGGDALQRKAMSHKPSFINIDIDLSWLNYSKPGKISYTIEILLLIQIITHIDMVCLALHES